MRLLLAALALALSIGVAPPPSTASAQFLDSHLQAQRHDNLRRHQQRVQRQRQARRGTARRGGLNAHQRACAQRYRSYNPRTDRYVVRRGVTARCRL